MGRFKLSQEQELIIKKLHAVDEDYTMEDLIESRMTTDSKIQIIYSYGKKFGWGQSSTWTEGIERILEVLDITVDGVNN